MKMTKLRTSVLIIVLVLLADQALKLYIKTQYPIGEVTRIFGWDWARIHFIENSGMAWGWKFGNEAGKAALTLFRLAAVLFGTWLLVKFAREKYSTGFMVCISLIYAGAAGNLIDSMFYGMIFDKGYHFEPSFGDYISYAGVATIGNGGYSSFLHGSVVDMLYFPMIHSRYPSWFPVVGGDTFEFFAPIFNIADAAISTGVIALLVFQKKFHKKEETVDKPVDGHPAAEAN
jgi:signal peptidase II